MLQAVKRILCLVALMAALPSAWAFSLGGPIGNGGDAWQVPEIGYGLNGDIVAPKNIGEEYRRNTPFMYYAADANFIGYFGSNGIVAVDQAFAIFNGITNVSSYSADLSEFTLNTKVENYQAGALGLYDLKSYALYGLAEQMGLAPPDRYTWTLRARYLVPGGTLCPDDEEYLVVQRNFDFLPSSLNDIQYSPYVNGVLYSYLIQEICTGPNPLAVTVPLPQTSPVDAYSAVAAAGFTYGTLYTGLTRDDVAGLRYLWNTNNYNFESPATGSEMIVTNTQPSQLLTTLDLGLFIDLSKTTPPDVLQGLYPNLVVTSSTNFFQTVITTNNFVYFTNQSVLPVFSNSVPGSLTNGYYFTNQPGPTVINYQPQQLLTTLDLALFADQSVTNDPATLQALYPGLQILKATYSIDFVSVTNYIYYLTNLFGAPYPAPAVPRFLVVSINNQVPVTNWTYTFGNVFTNHSYPKRPVVTQSIYTTNESGSGSVLIPPIITVKTNYTTNILNKISGDFFIIPTNWCGFEVVSVAPLNVPPYTFNFVNTIFYNGFGPGGNVGTNFTTNAFSMYQNVYNLFTNRTYVVQPGVCEPVLVPGTNYSTNVATIYQYQFGNIVTNSYFTNSPVTIITTNIGSCFGGSVGDLCTNITQISYYTNKPSGDFYLVPSNWCGFTILATNLTTIVYTTNVFTLGNAGQQQYIQTTITSFTNHTFNIQPQTCDFTNAPAALRQGVDHIQFIRANFDSLLGQFFAPVTNNYTMMVLTNSQLVKQYFRRIVTQPDFLFSAADLINSPNIFTYQRNINFDQGNILTGLAGPGVINPATTMTFNKSGAVLINDYPFLTGGSVTNYANSITWASFDGTTNAPVVYPSGTSIGNLESQLLLQISPVTVPDGVVGVAYPATTFTTSGGGAFAAPFTWSAVDSSKLPPGLSISSTGTLSGTPTQAGTYDFAVQLTDAVSRTVTWNYSITIN